MASEIVLPQWGMEMQDGTIVRWLKQEGDEVAEGEPIVEVETAKLQTELESTACGNTQPHRSAGRGDCAHPGRAVRDRRAGRGTRAVRRACRPVQRATRTGNTGRARIQWRWRSRSTSGSSGPTLGPRARR